MQLNLNHLKDEDNQRWSNLKFIDDSQLNFNIHSFTQFNWKNNIKRSSFLYKKNVLLYSYALNNFTSKYNTENHMKKEE